jgi:multimeric flavodoxin WrbA
MTKNIVILKGSPRQQGNSSVLADPAMIGAEVCGASVESFYLHGMDIRGCDGCEECRETGVCVIQDDMQPIYGRLEKADGIVLASPIDWFTYSGQLKLCIDR